MRLNILAAKSTVKPARQRYPWTAPAAIGVILFATTYWVIPNWATVYLASLEQNVFYPILEKFIGESIEWLQRFGAGAAIASAAVSLFVYYRDRRQPDRLCAEQAGDNP